MRKRLFSFALIAVAIFTAGFLMGAKSPEIKWIGFLVSGKPAPENPHTGILIPPPPSFASSVDSNIEIGLRDDGVVVWKRKQLKLKNLNSQIEGRR